MSKTLDQIAQQLSTPTTVKKTVPTKTKEVEEAKPIPKVQLIYAFNGVGKTRLSKEFKNLIAPKSDDDEPQTDFSKKKFLYYNAFTEDLFYWDNDFDHDAEPKLKIQPNLFTDWILNDQGEGNIIKNFQLYTDEKLTPHFSGVDVIKEGKKTEKKTYPEVTFTYTRGDDTDSGNVKISKGEERNFVWSIFYTLLEQVIENRNDVESGGDDFNQLEYVFIDDPVSSLDDNHLIELAVRLASLIKSSMFEDGKGLKFIITTHNPLFYNVLYNEFNNDLIGKKSDGSEGKLYKKAQSKKYILRKNADGTLKLIVSDVNDHPFSYHLFLLSELQKLQNIEQVEKYHFNFLRNILEKTATFLGYKKWNELLKKLPEEDQDVTNRLLNLYSHSAHSSEEIADLTDDKKEKFIKLIKDFAQIYNFAEMKEEVNA